MPISQEEVTTALKFNLPEWVSDSDRVDILTELGDFIVNEVISYTTSGVSPVTGSAFKKLNSKYAAAEKAGDTVANLSLHGDMLDALTYHIDASAGELIVGIFDEKQAPKAYNHNVGDTLPRRPFIPNNDGKFISDIMGGARDLLDELVANLDRPKDASQED